ncbi:hypothetical protein M758_11G052100 [Ceratodon purpureus]|nr:hypothetical protein M758_11G052100 [Ceratodon purpureus]
MDYEVPVTQRRRLCRSSCPGCKTKQSPGREEDHHEWRVSVATPQPGTQFSSKNYELSTCCRLQRGPAPMCPKVFPIPPVKCRCNEFYSDLFNFFNFLILILFFCGSSVLFS